jgi:hypothetical protein
MGFGISAAHQFRPITVDNCSKGVLSDPLR